MEVEEGKVAKKSGSAESGVPFGQGKIKMEVKRKGSAPDGDADREYFIKVIWFIIIQCIYGVIIVCSFDVVIGYRVKQIACCNAGRMNNE